MKEENFDDLMYQAFAKEEKQRTGTDHDRDDRKGCLSDEQISHYLESLLSDAERDRVQEHLFDCPFCLQLVIDVVKSEALEQREISKARERMESVLPAKTGLDEIKDAVIKPLKISLAWIGGQLRLKETDAMFMPFWNELRPVLVRGGSPKKALSLPPFSKTFEDYKVRIRVMEEEEGKCTIQCEIFPLTETKERPRIKVELMKSGRMLRSFLLENDSLMFQGIPPGEYILNIRDEGRSIGDVSIEIK
ncbi:MAG: zf-HC2 domain-containing protein [bacterium]